MTVHLVHGGDPALLADGVSALVHSLVGDQDRALVVDDITDEDYEIARIVDAARTPPFLTDRRVVVARHVEQFSRQDDVAPLVDYVVDPLDTTELVLVAAGTVHKLLVDALKKHGGEIVDTDPGRAARELAQGAVRRCAREARSVERAISSPSASVRTSGACRRCSTGSRRRTVRVLASMTTTSNRSSAMPAASPHGSSPTRSIAATHPPRSIASLG